MMERKHNEGIQTNDCLVRKQVAWLARSDNQDGITPI